MNHDLQFLVWHDDAVLFTWIFAEQAGLPIPTAPLLLAVGSLASAGQRNLAWSVGLVLAACLMADSLWYHIGRWRGRRVLRLLCWISLVPVSCVRRTKAALRRHGMGAVLVAKFVPGLNFVVPPLAAISGVSKLRFLLFDSLASIVWAGAYITLGYLSRGQLERAATHGSKLEAIWVAVLIAATAVFLGVRFMRNHRRRVSLRAPKGSPAGQLENRAQEARALGA